MKKYLLPKEGQFYKANLHSHSTVSDGERTPEELKEMYKAQGYSVFAYTDHDNFVTHNELTDEEFLVINGHEASCVEIIDDPDYAWRKVCHLCLLAPSPDVTEAPMARDFGKGYSREKVNSLIKKAKEEGFFVTYNHPTWSRERYDDYMNFHGFDCLEISNFNCIAGGTPEYNESKYDDMLAGGKRIYCVAADDNHNTRYFNDSFGGFAMIKAQGLDYETVFRALQRGDFYASEGPEIHELYIEDGTVTVKTSPAASVRFSTSSRRGRNVTPEKTGGELVTEASYRTAPDERYFRVTVTAPDGKRAYTRAYFADEI
ncbi:MAG: PHP domain-containing protein [Clostridia bacterium]|nr:PHP domain-containing protein [Clostridia bacterium]